MLLGSSQESNIGTLKELQGKYQWYFLAYFKALRVSDIVEMSYAIAKELLGKS
jgi:hypothetical protein